MILFYAIFSTVYNEQLTIPMGDWKITRGASSAHSDTGDYRPLQDSDSDPVGDFRYNAESRSDPGS
ncbi:hypothetical protein C8J55DRAFT_527159 [Lentinula edodes]|uniref:Uncharacterized protein n=1 Tax=Lentinula lateritia TaxID=40482 RepID=A0A9W9DFB2_9AGAR|nr:hypothetical protein C8J55DRAFT_527159 [Lentinula edodes]